MQRKIIPPPKHYEKNPSKKGMEYVHILVEAIRVRVLAKEIG